MCLMPVVSYLNSSSAIVEISNQSISLDKSVSDFF